MILAGVAISLATGQNSIFSKANNAATKWNTAVGKESNTIKNILEITDKVTGAGDDDIIYVGDVPIPEGYKVSQIDSEDSVLEGLVIYEILEKAEVEWKQDETDGTNESTITIGEETTNLQETVNQYVWIPVEDINDMVMCESNNKLPEGEENKICNIELVDNEETGEKVLKCTNPDYSTTATNLVGRLYIGSNTNTTDSKGNRIYSYIMKFTNEDGSPVRDQTYDENGYHEPDTVNADSSNSLELTQLQNEFKLMATSVARYGGFYISRYEIGEGGNSKKGQIVLTTSSTTGNNYLGANKWYGLYNTIKNSGANKQMIWGCQYDQVIKFIGEQAQVGHSDRKLTEDHALSGQNELDCMNNIYDLEGNYNEWTAESTSASSRVFRGDYYGSVNFGSFNPASAHSSSSTTSSNNSYYSSRSTLYL